MVTKEIWVGEDNVKVSIIEPYLFKYDSALPSILA
jgi:hypothetical protein